MRIRSHTRRTASHCLAGAFGAFRQSGQNRSPPGVVPRRDEGFCAIAGGDLRARSALAGIFAASAEGLDGVIGPSLCLPAKSAPVGEAAASSLAHLIANPQLHSVASQGDELAARRATAILAPSFLCVLSLSPASEMLSSRASCPPSCWSQEVR